MVEEYITNYYPSGDGITNLYVTNIYQVWTNGDFYVQLTNSTANPVKAISGFDTASFVIGFGLCLVLSIIVIAILFRDYSKN